NAAEIMPRMVEHLGEPLADNSVIPTYFVSQFARRHVTVALTGDGGDEVFAGYKRYAQVALADRLDAAHLTGVYRQIRRLTLALQRLRPSKRARAFPFTRLDEALALDPI